MGSKIKIEGDSEQEEGGRHAGMKITPLVSLGSMTQKPPKILTNHRQRCAEPYKLELMR